MLAICNVNLVMGNHMIYDGAVLIDQGRIADFGETRLLHIPDGAEILDGKGNYIGPGFIDIHTHAGEKIFFTDQPEQVAKTHLFHGTTSILPALYFSLNRGQMLAAADKFREAQKTTYGSIIQGIYMEGPYLNPNYGCDRTNNPWLAGVNSGDYLPLIEGVKDLARVWCIAPELPEINLFVQDVKAASAGAVFSVAHSEATPYQVESYIDDGLRLATHHTNATGTLNKYPECRGVCVDEAVNANPDIYAELICDSRGIHVDPYMLRLVLKIKGRDRIILVSDNFAATGPTPPGYEGITDINFDYEGEIAGTNLTLDAACRNMMKHTGASICDVFTFASANPAKLLGMRDRGRIEKGARADLVLVDHMINVQKVFLNGTEIC